MLNSSQPKLIPVIIELFKNERSTKISAITDINGSFIKYFIHLNEISCNFIDQASILIKQCFFINDDVDYIFFIHTSLINKSPKMLKFLEKNNINFIKDGHDKLKFNTKVDIIDEKAFKSKIKKINFTFKYNFSVGIIGKSNVGKSTLINNILNSNVNLINNNFSTTTAHNTFYKKINNINFEFIDSVGFLQSIKNQKFYLNSEAFIFKKANTCLLLTSVQDYDNYIFRKFLGILQKHNCSYIILLTKCDLVSNEVLDTLKNNLQQKYGLDANVMCIDNNNFTQVEEYLVHQYQTINSFNCDINKLEEIIKNRFKFIRKFTKFDIKDNVISFYFKLKYKGVTKNVLIFFKRFLCKEANIIGMPVNIVFHN